MKTNSHLLSVLGLATLSTFMGCGSSDNGNELPITPIEELVYGAELGDEVRVSGTFRFRDEIVSDYPDKEGCDDTTLFIEDDTFAIKTYIYIDGATNEETINMRYEYNNKTADVTGKLRNLWVESGYGCLALCSCDTELLISGIESIKILD